MSDASGPVTVVCWLRRDLRLRDHRALRAALRGADAVVPLFVLDPRLTSAARMSRARLAYLADALTALDAGLRDRGGRLVIREGDPATVVPSVAQEVGATVVHWHRDHTPYAAARDATVARALSAAGMQAHVHDGALLHAPGTVRTREGGPFKVYGPFARAVRALGVDRPVPAPTSVPVPALPGDPPPTPALLGVSPSDRALDGGEPAALRRLESFLRSRADAYAERRDVPAIDGTSRLSADLHFGTLSPRTVWSRLGDGPGHRAFAAQLLWREFLWHVLAEWPDAARQEWNPRFRGLPWHGEGPEAAAWRAGETGFPMVDAAMRQLATESWMHNRGRMIVASFLCKHLLVDWRVGEAHFLRHLVDGDWANNNGGWQWAAGTGTDAQPWFRILNPVRQGARFDREGTYVRRYVPELAGVPARWIQEPWRMPPETARSVGVRIGRDYPAPMVDLGQARARALDWFGSRRG